MTTPAPAEIGASIAEIDTPALIVELDAFEANVAALREVVERTGVRLRAHAKTHKSADIARIQMQQGGACGICCQKVSEAEALVAAGIGDVLVSNQVIGARRADRLARLATRARILVCVDDPANVADLSGAALRHGATIGCLVEIDVGMGRCGVGAGEPALELARTVAAAPGLRFAGIQAYQGRAQHAYRYADRRALIDRAIADASRTRDLLVANGLAPAIVAGAGTGSFPIEAGSGVYDELQCGSYVFMDADYGRVEDEAGAVGLGFQNSLFVLTEVMSKTAAGRAVCDAGLKASSVDSGLPIVFGRGDVRYAGCSDEHGMIEDPGDALRVGDRLRLVPGHCDPTVNLYDWYVAVRGGRVEALWPITARGCLV